MPPKRANRRKAQKSVSKPRPKAKSAGKLKATTGKKRSQDEEEPTSSPPPAKRLPSSPLASHDKDNGTEAEGQLIARRFGAETIGATWMKILLPEFKKPYVDELIAFVNDERSKYSIYPEAKDVFTWTTACTIDEVKVVVLGQDPYFNPNQAHGLSFSVRIGVPIPPSLRNIFKELSNDIEGFKAPDHGCLMGWAKQGVLLLNAVLTVREKKANSHARKGWEKLTDAVIQWLNDNTSGLVFLLWGNYSQKKGSFVDETRHCVLKSAHPSPLSATSGTQQPFLGSKHFSQTNAYLTQHGKKPIDWSYLPKTLDD